MSLPTNNKKGENQGIKNQTSAKGSKFIKGTAKPAAITKKVRSTGANRGS